MNQALDPFDLPRTEACEQVEDELAEVARTLETGGELSAGYLAVAAHLLGCPRCRIVLAEVMNEPADISGLSEAPVDTAALFERAWLRGLTRRRDPVARIRAAEGLGGAAMPGAEELAALAMIATEDRHPKVREAAIGALDKLDTQVSIPNRVIEAWAADPEKAKPFVAGVLERLARTFPSILRLAPRRKPHGRGFRVIGAGRVRGDIEELDRDVWLRLSGLPPLFESLRPVVALPTAELEDTPPMRWRGDPPGLVPSDVPVTDGSVEVLLGADPPPHSEPLFRKMYLLGAKPGTTSL